MRRTPAKLLILCAAALSLFTAAGRSNANKLDLTAARFIQCHNNGQYCYAQNAAWERFMTEYAFGISPKIMAPASTLGYSGFYLGIEGSVMTIPGNSEYLTGATPSAAEYEAARWRIGTGEYNAEPPAMFMPTIHVRKGLPWSVELGSSISYLAQSELVALGGEVKWSLFEGYRHGFLGAMPDIAARGSVNRVIGQSDVDMTVLGVDGSISYPFGLGGAISLEPYAGYQYLWSFVRKEPMIYRDGEGTSDITYYPSGEQVDLNNDGDLNDAGENAIRYDMSSTGLTEPDLGRHKIFAGFVFRFELLAITMDFAWGLPQTWKTYELSCPQNNSNCAVDDPAAGEWTKTAKASVDTQFVFTFGAGLQF